jgi:hypothetical protein
MFSKLKITCKDHEFPIDHRNLQSAVNNRVSGLSMFVRHVLAPHLRLDYMVRDSENYRPRFEV